MRLLFQTIAMLTMGMTASCKDTRERTQPVYQSITESVYASGKIKADSQYQAFAPVTGIVKEVYPTEGDMVRVGTPILAITDDEQQLRKQNALLDARFSDYGANQDKLAEAAQQIKLAQNKLQNDSVLYIRQKALWDQQVGTRVELEQRQLNYEDARTRLFSARVTMINLKRQLLLAARQSSKNLAIASRQAADFILVSKINGKVYSLYKKKGEQVNPQTPLALIGKATGFLLELDVDEADIVKVHLGQVVLVIMESYKDRVFHAVVSKIYPLMDEQSKTITVEAAFKQSPEKLYPNESFEANIIIRRKAQALLIPRNYLMNDSLVIRAGGDTVKVKTGLKDYRMAEILSGINAGDQLIKP